MDDARLARLIGPVKDTDSSIIFDDRVQEVIGGKLRMIGNEEERLSTRVERLMLQSGLCNIHSLLLATPG